MINLTILNFKDAPADLQALSNNGGDEDYVIILHGDPPIKDWGLMVALESIIDNLDISGNFANTLGEGREWRGRTIWITTHA